MVVNTTLGPFSRSAEFGTGREVGMRRMEERCTLNWNFRDRNKDYNNIHVCVEMGVPPPASGNVKNMYGALLSDGGLHYCIFWSVQ